MYNILNSFLVFVPIFTLIFWIFFSKWACKNKNKIPGRLFEYLFFLFLFFGTFYLTIIPYSGKSFQFAFRLSIMSFSIISAIFSGYLHYIKKLYN